MVKKKWKKIDANRFQHSNLIQKKSLFSIKSQRKDKKIKENSIKR